MDDHKTPLEIGINAPNFTLPDSLQLHEWTVIYLSVMFALFNISKPWEWTSSTQVCVSDLNDSSDRVCCWGECCAGIYDVVFTCCWTIKQGEKSHRWKMFFTCFIIFCIMSTSLVWKTAHLLQSQYFIISLLAQFDKNLTI